MTRAGRAPEAVGMVEFAEGRPAPGEHAASIAWTRLNAGASRPCAVHRMQEKSKASVYRLEGVGPMGGSVVAKCSSRERIRRERAMYEQVLPSVAVTVPRYFGGLEEPDSDRGWIFLEYAAGESYAPERATHRELAGRWLGMLHLSGARLMPSARLPDRGAAYHLVQLRAARRTLSWNLGNPALTEEDVSVARSVIRQCDIVESRWHEVEDVCARLPLTLVHGDFAPKNMRVRVEPVGSLLLPFDWGSAGAAPPAADLVQWSGRTAEQWGYWANPDLPTYLSVVRRSWPGLDLDLLRRAATVGRIFRCLVCVALSAESFASRWVERAARNMRIYEAETADALESFGWAGRVVP